MSGFRNAGRRNEQTERITMTKEHIYIAPVAAPFPLDEMAARVRKSSNFRFEWQFYTFEYMEPSSCDDVRGALAAMIAQPDCHRFLRDTFDNDLHGEDFEIEPLRDCCRIVDAGGEFEDIMASAENDYLGAYSHQMGHATTLRQREAVGRVFASAGPYRAFQLALDCDVCKYHREHLFTNWFYGVAWDWCFLLTWAHSKLLWIGCLTDTD